MIIRQSEGQSWRLWRQCAKATDQAWQAIEHASHGTEEYQQAVKHWRYYSNLQLAVADMHVQVYRAQHQLPERASSKEGTHE